MSFRIGQRVRVLRSTTGVYVGAVLEIVSGPEEQTIFGQHQNLVPPGTPIWQLSNGFWAPSTWLAPIDDGRSPIAWTESLLKLCRVGAQRKEGV